MSLTEELPKSAKLAVDTFMSELPKAVAVQLSATINAKISDILGTPENQTKIMDLLKSQIEKSTLESGAVVNNILTNSTFRLSVSKENSNPTVNVTPTSDTVPVSVSTTVPGNGGIRIGGQRLQSGNRYQTKRYRKKQVSRLFTRRRKLGPFITRHRGGNTNTNDGSKTESLSSTVQSAIDSALSVAIKSLTDKITEGVMDPLIINVNKHLNETSLISNSISDAINAQMKTILEQKQVTEIIINTTQQQFEQVLSENKAKFADALYSKKCEQNRYFNSG